MPSFSQGLMPGCATADDLAGIVRPLVGLLARVSRRILHDDSLVEDAIQETLLCFWSQENRPSNPRAWLLNAVTLRSLHLARTRRRLRRHEELACLRRPEWSIRDDPADDLDRDEVRQRVDEALDRVAEDYRSVFVLRAFEEMDYEAIAETLRIPIGTVRSRLNRSRRALRQILSETLAEHEARNGFIRHRPIPIRLDAAPASDGHPRGIP